MTTIDLGEGMTARLHSNGEVMLVHEDTGAMIPGQFKTLALSVEQVVKLAAALKEHGILTDL